MAGKLNLYLTYLMHTSGAHVNNTIVRHETIIRSRRGRKKIGVIAANLSIAYGLPIIADDKLHWMLLDEIDQAEQENPVAHTRGGIEGSWSVREAYKRIGEGREVPETTIRYWEATVEQASGLSLAEALGSPSFQSVVGNNSYRLLWVIWQRRKGRKIDTKNFRRRLLKEKLNAKREDK